MGRKLYFYIIALLLLITGGSTVYAAETAVLAGGCFWGVEGVYEHVTGVLEVESGYAGGKAGTANYNAVSKGFSRHAESVRISFDPLQISYEKILEIFFLVVHDPTQLNYQGPDRGRQYRSVVFYTGDEQRQTVEKVIHKVAEMNIYKGTIVTALDPLETFYPAEGYHQNFMQRNPADPYVSYWDWPKVAHLQAEFPEFYAERSWTVK